MCSLFLGRENALLKHLATVKGLTSLQALASMLLLPFLKPILNQNVAFVDLDEDLMYVLSSLSSFWLKNM